MEFCEWDGLSQRITLNVNRLEMKRGVGGTPYAGRMFIYHSTELTEQVAVRGSIHSWDWAGEW